MDNQRDTDRERPKTIASQTSILSTISEKKNRVLWFFNDMRVYIALDVIAEFFFGVVDGYYWAMTTSIEKEFQLTGVKLGFLMNAWDIGRLPILPLLSFFGGRYHIPRILGFMQFIRAGAIVLLILPHFLFGQSIIALLKASAEDVPMTAVEEPLFGNYTFQTTVCHPPLYNDTVDTKALAQDILRSSDISYGMFIASYVMFGLAFPAPRTLGMMYYDNNFEKDKLPLLIGITGAVFPISEFVGGMLATWFSTMYVDLSEPTITPEDPRWISAWWLGLMITLVPPVLLGPLICLFPRRMRKKGTINFKIPCITKGLDKHNSESERKEESPKTEKKRLGEDEKRAIEVVEKEEAAKAEEEFKRDTENTYTIKEFPRTLLRLLKNAVFMLLVLYYILENFAWSGWWTFYMKYYEHVFRVPAWKVMTINTVASVIVSPIGSVLGGILVVRLRPTFARASLLMIFTVVVWCVIGVGRMFITCGDSTYAGLNYTGPEQLMGDCNAGCECNLNAFSPVCDNGLTYFSPCHAGCEMGNITKIDGIIQPHLKEYFDCNCTDSGIAAPGRCEGECDLIYLYVALRTIGILVWSLTGSATMLMLIRSVGYSEKAFAIGIMICLGSLLGSLPSAPLIGRIMDGTCTVWQMLLGEQGNCWIHDTAQMRFRMYGWTLSFMALQCFVLLAVYVLAKRRNLKLFDEDDPIELKKRNSERNGDGMEENGLKLGLSSECSMDSDSNPVKITKFNSINL